MEENKIAQLDVEQLQELKDLEDRLGVTLIAYDTSFNSSSSEVST